jgi:hypothetical protein
LVFYNVVYVIPLFIIVGVVTWRLNKQKLTERQGRILKLFSGMMMTVLGCTFLFIPSALKNAISILGIITIALCLTILMIYLDKRFNFPKGNNRMNDE